MPLAQRGVPLPGRCLSGMPWPERWVSVSEGGRERGVLGGERCAACGDIVRGFVECRASECERGMALLPWDRAQYCMWG